MKRKRELQKFAFSALLVFSLLAGFVPRSAAQDVWTSEDFGGGSSAFIFNRSRKATQRKLVFRADVQRSRKQRAETTRQIIRQSALVAKISPKRTRSKEVNPNSAAYREVLTKRKSAVEAAVVFAGVGEYHLNRDDPNEALTFFREATALDAKNLNARNGLSEALTRQGDKLLNEEKYDLAKLPYEEAVQVNPKNAGAHAGLAEIYAEQQNAEQAIANYEKALALDPDLKQLNAPLGVLYFQKDEVAKSEAALEKALADNPNNAETQFFFGLVRYKQTKYEEALQAFRRSIEIDATNPEVYYFLGEVQDKLGNNKDSIAAYRQAVAIKPRYEEAWFDLGAALYNRASNEGPDSAYFAEAIKAYQKTVMINPINGQAHANLGDVFRQLDRLDEAISSYRLATTFIKNDPELYSNFGFVAAKRAVKPGYKSFWKMSIDNFERAAALNSAISNFVDYQNLGWAYYNAAQSDIRDPDKSLYRGKMTKARDAFQKALTLDPPEKVAAAINLNLGTTLTDLGEYQAAAEALRKATELQKNWVPAINELGIAYRKKGDFENAAKQFRRAIEIDGDFARGYYNLAETEFKRGDIKESKKLYEKLKSMKQVALVRELELATGGAVMR